MTERYTDRCLTCAHWGGDRAAQWVSIRLSTDMPPGPMDLHRGWPLDGPCEVRWKWSELDIDGNAGVTVGIDANFGCVWHEPIAREGRHD